MAKTNILKDNLFSIKEMEIIARGFNGKLWNQNTFSKIGDLGFINLRGGIASCFEFSVEDGWLTKEEYSDVIAKIEKASDDELKASFLNACDFWEECHVILPNNIENVIDEKGNKRCLKSEIRVILGIDDLKKILYDEAIEKLIRGDACLHFIDVFGKATIEMNKEVG